MAGPVVSSALYNFEGLAIDQAVRDELQRPLENVVAAASDRIGALLRNAYLDGLRDGFAQGVASVGSQEETKRPAQSMADAFGGRA